ncbi:nucleotidyltransferase domain-containing protein [Actinocatenispora rupis]|uniref:Polymerase nucleotidyl transferase domain-containing protein n=1 Tax=Actinocatenispora rupis TaxID=519421 RepID=A0A8J3J8B8_9ACTN|nr:nucleotidyltransferase domain-containing protein [Actinocatenispora rupis]GID13817.1 hypothetical protein Aru02nite_47060 [Actinocatenispora rupis]
MCVVRDDVVRALLDMGVPPSILEDFPEVPSEVEGLMVYGSQARGDAVSGSDLDVLALVPAARPSTFAGDVNISYYTNGQLATGVGTLFGSHLKRDGKIIWDQHGRLTRAVGAMGDVDTDRLLTRAWHMCELFTSPERDLPRYLLGLLREARYLLRSCLYARAIADGNPCFSVRELAVRLDDPHLADLLASRQSTPAAAGDLKDCLLRLRAILGEFPPSRHGSLEATIVNDWGSPSDLLSMGFMALGSTGNGTDYAEVEKILL